MSMDWCQQDLQSALQNGLTAAKFVPSDSKKAVSVLRLVRHFSKTEQDLQEIGRRVADFQDLSKQRRRY